MNQRSIADNSSMVAPAGPSLRSGLLVASAGKIPVLDELSLTVCPVHLLSMGPNAWVEMAWAARDAAQRDMNLERRGWFETVKCLLLERDLPPSRIGVQPLFHGSAR